MTCPDCGQDKCICPVELMTPARKVEPLPEDVVVYINRQIILRNNAEICRLTAESNECRDALLAMGVEAYPPYPSDIKAELAQRDKARACIHSHWHWEGNFAVCDLCGYREEEKL